jgi:hypothetical protein
MRLKMHWSRSRGSNNQRSSSQGSEEEKIKTKQRSAITSIHTASDQTLVEGSDRLVIGSDQINGLRKGEEKIDQRWESRTGRESCSIIDLMGTLEENRRKSV